jgi:hypothetical protein
MILSFQHTYALGIPTCATKKPDIESEKACYCTCTHTHTPSRALEACDEAARDVFFS